MHASKRPRLPTLSAFTFYSITNSNSIINSEQYVTITKTSSTSEKSSNDQLRILHGGRVLIVHYDIIITVLSFLLLNRVK